MLRIHIQKVIVVTEITEYYAGAGVLALENY